MPGRACVNGLRGFVGATARFRQGLGGFAHFGQGLGVARGQQAMNSWISAAGKPQFHLPETCEVTLSMLTLAGTRKLQTSGLYEVSL